MAPASRRTNWNSRCPATARRSSPNDIHDIRTLGFRGEALPSIGAVSRLSIRSRTAGAERRRDRGRGRRRRPPIRPAGANRGTAVEVRDLFFATPARLKFMKSERAEAAAIADVVQAHRDRLPGRALHACPAPTARRSDFAGRPTPRPAGADRPGDGRGVSGEFAADRRDARRRAPRRPCLDPFLSRGPTRCSNMSMSTAGRCATG